MGDWDGVFDTVDTRSYNERKDLRGCKSCKEKMLTKMKSHLSLVKGGRAVAEDAVKEIVQGITLDKDAALPRLVHIVNTHNEADDVRQTLISFRAAYDGPYTAIVVADETTDGSCDNLDPLITSGAECPRCQGANLIVSAPGVLACGSCQWHFAWRDDDRLIILRNDKHVGCGRAKEQARLYAEQIHPDIDYVIVHSDGHCRHVEGDLNTAVRIAAQNECIVAPGVAPLHCPANEQPRYGDEWGDRKTKLKYSHTTWGGNIVVDPLGAKVDACGRPRRKYALRESTFWAVFLMSGHTLKNRMGGWNKLPGRWGSQEIGLALRAWFAAVPIVTTRDIICGHRYRADQRKDKKPFAKYSIRTSERRANHRYVHQVMFTPRTCRKVWKPLWKELCPSAGGQKRLKASELDKQGKDFRKHYKRRTDEEFQRTFCPDGWPNKLIPLDDITAVILCYRRPENQQKCIDAIKAAGIKVWAWCNLDKEREGACTIPEGCERVFTDTANASTWGRYCVAPLVDTPWILFCDDDTELTSAGIRALRAGGALGIDNCGLIGARFREPNYDDYHKRKYFKSHNVREATPVDMLWPKGQLIYRDMAVELFGAGNREWQKMREAVGTTSGDDLISTVMQEQLYPHMEPFGRFPHVVHSNGKGYREHHAEGKPFALTKQKGRITKKRKTMKLWRKMGWRSVLEHVNVLADFWGPKDEEDAA